MTLTEIIETLNNWAIDTEFDINQDWNEEKTKMSQELQILLIAKANLELIHKTGNQIFISAIKK